jgi:hypothetical protein
MVAASVTPALWQCLRLKNVSILHDEGIYKHLHLRNLFSETRQEVKSSHVNGSTNLLNSPSSVLVTYCGK